ncbi:hypothetical protein BBB39_13060 [Bordetella trematum]|uniref:Phage protein n=1 Tax=Bordetella trematum TaxID=123899 RepID=A0A157STW3_9BORD|nr:hypothetical protein [Bordetella trematum]AZR94604.1 hypothetical protein BBB39_13060 [Bordetella trematum]NNH19125.1 hypothetical protein [Bordetella trematum]SAI58656.1 Uncharacterised protein [Bordetella trematum]SAI73877.1 Uncharacterised protein [Bordetella trematum]SUV97156.1 Uncharacterised protein [Bordetella trematum]
MAQQEKPAAPDWERIEADYRAGLLSVREIASSNGVSHVAIGKRAKRDGWERDLQAKIKAKADALVTKAEVTKEVTSEQAVTERRIVDANAQVIADVRVSHRRDIARARSLAMKLLDELEIQTDNIDLLEQIETALANGDDAPDGLMRVFQRVTSIAGRIDSAKKLAEAMKVLVGMEREAYGIVEAAKVEHTGKDGGPVEVVHMTPEAIREVMEKDDC